jgi:uncharacterized protein (TIGR02246 family)
MSELRTRAEDRAELERLDAEWVEAAASRDVERILSYWADDAIVIAPGTPPHVGKDAIREYVVASLAIPGFSISWQTDQFTVAAAGDLAHGVGTQRATFTGDNGELVTSFGHVVTIWRKEEGGWKCVIDIWNDVAPAE